MRYIFKLIREGRLEETVETVVEDVDRRVYLVLGIGVATCFFGFIAGAIANMYLASVNSPLVTQFRATLSYKSAVFGDGILLPIVNMVIMVFLLRHWKFVKKGTIQAALFFGICITTYFHVTQAMEGIINWTMPEPWQWNALGVWHGVYMLFVTSFLSLFYLVLLKVIKKKRIIPKEAAIVTIGIAIFLVLLRLDYIALDLTNLIPQL